MKLFGIVLADRWRQSLYLMVLFCLGSACSCGQSRQDSPATSSSAVSSGSKGPKNGSEFVVGWIPMDTPKNEYWKMFDEGLQDAIESRGAKFLYRSPQFDAVKQNDRIRELIVEDVDFIVVYPLDGLSISSAVVEANNAGIPVAVFLNSVPSKTGAKVLFTVTESDREAARAAGQAMVDALTEKHGEPKGKVLEVQGRMTTTGAKLRFAGFHEVIDGYENIVVTSKTGNWDTGIANRVIQEWMAVHSDTDGIYLHSDANYTPAAQAALSAIDRWVPKGEPGHVILTGEDGTNIAIHAIRHGFMEFTSDFSIADLAPLLGELIMEYLHAGTVPKIGDVLERPDTLWKEVTVSAQEGMSGPIISIPITGVTQENASDPKLYANKYQGAPNGMSPLIWK